MARAHYIYIVAEPNYDGDNIQAAFTVKHECKTWLKNNSPGNLTRCVYRFSDGGKTDQGKTWSEKEFLDDPR